MGGVGQTHKSGGVDKCIFIADLGLPRWLRGKHPPANAGDTRDTGSIPGLGRSSGEGNGNPRQYSCPGNPMDRGAWWLQSMGSKKVGHD